MNSEFQCNQIPIKHTLKKPNTQKQTLKEQFYLGNRKET